MQQENQSNGIKKQLYTEKEVSEAINFKRTKIWQMVKSGEFPPPIKFGRWNRWHIADIQQWTEQQRQSKAGA